MARPGVMSDCTIDLCVGQAAGRLFLGEALFFVTSLMLIFVQVL